MSWQDKIKTQLVIQTGDGSRYRPKWLPEGMDQEFNVTNFEFPEVAGTLVDRRKRKGYVYPLTIIFDGADHLDEAEQFRNSANDPRPWQMTHPYFGVVTVQPSTIKYDNSGYNATKITMTLMESITTAYPQTGTQPAGQVQITATTTRATLAQAAARNARPTASNAAQVNVNNRKFYLNALADLPADIANDYYDAYYTALSQTENLVITPADAIAATQRLMVYPAYFTISVARRMALLRSEFDLQAISDAALPFITLAERYLYMALSGTVLTGMCVAAATPLDTDYQTRPDVLAIVAGITDCYLLYLAQLDALQTLNGGSTTSFIPDADALMQLDELMNYTLSNLFVIALSARQERSIILEEDSNWILLAHRFYGLDNEDANIQRLIQNNAAGISEMLQVLKGRTIIYYI